MLSVANKTKKNIKLKQTKNHSHTYENKSQNKFNPNEKKTV